MNIQDIISTYGSPIYALVIFFGGRWGLKYFTYFRQTKYNFLVFATVAGVAALLIEVALGTFKPLYSIGYLLTYTLVTSCYDMICDWLPFLKPKASVYGGSEEDDRDYVQYPTKASFPVPGAANTVYLDQSTNTDYVWDASTSGYIVTRDRPRQPPRFP